MLGHLLSEIRELACTDVDETASTCKWNKKAAEQLDKLNKGCNMTAGLEAKLSLAVGARVMLHRNIDTKIGLVNGAIGTVLSITVNHVTVQFDHISGPFNVQMVKSRFMVIKNFCLQKTVSTNPSMCCNYSQMRRFVIRLCHRRPLSPSVQCWNGLRSTIQGSIPFGITPGCV